MEKKKYPMFIKEDVNAFFSLFQNNLANFVVIAISMLGMGYPARIVYGMVIPGAAIIPLQVVAPILVFVGISMVSQTFASIPTKHYPAAVLAMFPYLANYLSTKFANSAPEALAAVSKSIVPLGQGAMFTAIILGAMLVFIIDNDYKKAAITSIVGAVMAAVGFIHSPKLAFMHNKEFVLAYVVVAITLVVFSFIKDTEEDKEKLENIVAD